jgi:hypothetical protein
VGSSPTASTNFRDGPGCALRPEVPATMGSFFGSVDWVEVFVPQAPLIETFVRGSLLYLGLVAQNAMVGPHHA